MTVTKKEGKQEFPAEAYAYVPDAQKPSTWKLRLWESPSKKETQAQVGRAVAAVGKGFRGQKVDIPAADRAAVMAKVHAAWSRVHKTPAPKESATPAAMKEAATTELNQICDLVCDALNEKLQPNAPEYGPSCFSIEALFPDRVITEEGGRYYAYPYSIDDANQVTLGEPKEVVESFSPVAGAAMEESVLMTEGAGDVFLESVDPEGRAWDAILCRSGLAKNSDRTYYPDAVLREAAPLFEGARIFAKADMEHRRDSGKDINKLVGWVSDVKFVEGNANATDTGYVAGRVNFAAGATALRETIADAWKRGKRDLVGLSIDAIGSARKATASAVSGARRIATAITKVSSVDLIVEPSAGGALVRLAEAADPDQESDPMKARMLATIQAKAPKIFAKINPATITDDELETRYSEALAEGNTAQAAAGGVSAAQLGETVRMVEARAYLRTAVATSKLPQIAQDKFLADWGKRDRFTEADVDAAIKAERTYMSHFSESGKVTLDEKGDVSVDDRAVKISGMLDAFFNEKHKDHRSVHSFKECYIEITGDKRVTGRLDDMDRARLAESLGAAFRESLDSTSFGNVLGDSITRRMVAEYNIQSQYDAWRQIATTSPVQDFRTQDRTLFGGYGNLPAVAQGDPYASLASPTDQQATYAVSKRGGTEDVTLEMIKNDDVGVIRRIPVKLARTAKRTLGQFVFDFIATNPLIYDGVAFFDAAHNNLGSTALAAAELGVARRAMMKQAELGSGARMSIPPKSILVPLDLVEAAWNIFQRGTNLDKTYIETMLLTIIPVWYWTDVTDWAIAADPADLPGIEIGFLDGQEEPELFVQDMPNVGSMFSNDKLTYKIRHIYGGNVLPGGEKAFYKEVVAG